MLIPVIQQNPALSAEALVTCFVTQLKLITSARCCSSKPSCFIRARQGQAAWSHNEGIGGGGPLSNLSSGSDQPCDFGRDSPIALFPRLPIVCLNN